MVIEPDMPVMGTLLLAHYLLILIVHCAGAWLGWEAYSGFYDRY